MEIIIPGTGYAWIFAAANLCKHLSIKVTLIDKKPYHQLLQQIHTVAAGIKKPEEMHKSGTTFSANTIFGVNICNGTVFSFNGHHTTRAIS